VFGVVQYAGAIYLAWLGVLMMRAKEGDAPVLDMQPHHFFRQAMLITLLNPKAIVFYMAFFPLFVDPARHQGLATFGVMAATIAGLTFLYCVIVISITHFAADRMRASPRVAVWLNRVAGTMLVGFGVKLALGK
jgi:threonine/homoserine/homoserine lactone efflux protein